MNGARCKSPRAGMLSLAFLLLCACGPLRPVPARETAFGVLGDAPYTQREIERLERVIEEMNAEPLEFVVHVGDIGRSAAACADAWLLERKAQFARIRHRFVLLPGDNEWSNCRQPLERLRRWREIFCERPAEFCEHQRWEAHGWVFVALNVPGHDNNVAHPEHGPRMKRVLEDLDTAAAAARGKAGLVILMQANPFLARGFDSLVEKLKTLAAERPGQVLLIHGDTHVYKDDEPLPGLRRIEVWGSPFVSWLRLPLPLR